MPAKKPKTIRVIAAELGMSLGHVRDAMKQGIDPRDIKSMKEFKASRRPRVDDRADMTKEPKPPGEIDSGEMSLEEFEKAIRQKDITVAEATVLKRQIEAMKQLVAVRREARQLLSIEAVKAHHIRIGAAVGAAMRALETEVPQLCLGLPLERSRPLVKDKARAIQAMLADMESEFWKDNQPT